MHHYFSVIENIFTLFLPLGINIFSKNERVDEDGCWSLQLGFKVENFEWFDFELTINGDSIDLYEGSLGQSGFHPSWNVNYRHDEPITEEFIEKELPDIVKEFSKAFEPLTLCEEFGVEHNEYGEIEITTENINCVISPFYDTFEAMEGKSERTFLNFYRVLVRNSFYAKTKFRGHYFDRWLAGEEINKKLIEDLIRDLDLTYSNLSENIGGKQ